MLPGLIRRGRRPTVGITVSSATITLRITADGADETDCFAAMEPTIATIRESLGEIIFGEENDELEHAVVELLEKCDTNLATVEWGTGGLVAERLRNLPESDRRFRRGMIVSDADCLNRVLGISPEVSAPHAPQSGELAELMARAWREKTGAELALATAALPKLDRKAADAPRVYFALASDQGTVTRSAPYFGEPTMIKARTAKQALNMVRLALLRDA